MSKNADGGLTVETRDLAQDHDRPPYLWGLIAGGAVFLLYVVTLAPTTAFWDTSEYIATAHILGVPHAPGNPLFMVLARAWEILLAPLGLSVAVRLNLLSAFTSAAAHGLWFLVVHHILGYFGKDRSFRIIGALVAVLISATAFTVWSQSNVNEKVYTVALFTIALLTWLLFRWQARVGEGRVPMGGPHARAGAVRSDNLLVLMAFILALSVGNHLMAFLAAPAIVVFILIVRPRTILNWKLYPAVVAVAVVGLSIHLYLPVRAALDPVINQNDPTCTGIGSALKAIVSYGKYGCVNLGELLTRAQYATLDPSSGEVLSQSSNHVYASLGCHSAAHARALSRAAAALLPVLRLAVVSGGAGRRRPASPSPSAVHAALHGSGTVGRGAASPSRPGELLLPAGPVRDPLTRARRLPE
ncbi:MAG: DUF2723 domain-containing protein, partial [Gemmatimonadetes bacterium]|nr:DUF2723 domain-containing protein [Gemmatimonadota bacterium]